ncbi:MAG: hypothetical protein JOZ15_18705, partial [Acidobacteria bacterium]|nr:hypothetical protein [Acidobacteriota bacterium]
MSSVKWVPLFGEFDVGAETLTFRGMIARPKTQEGEAQGTAPEASSVGIVLSDRTIVNGSISAVVEFEEVFSDTGCELILAFDVRTGGMISAGIPNFSWASFSIREWKPLTQESGTATTTERGWSTLAAGGSRSHLKPGRALELQATVNGSSVALDLDGVRVASANLTGPFNVPQQVGVWCCNRRDIRVSEFTMDVARPRAFIISEFKEPYDGIYNLVLKDTCKE